MLPQTPQRGKATAIFSLSTIINMSLKKKKGDIVFFIDFTKEFDTVERVKLWKKNFVILV